MSTSADSSSRLLAVPGWVRSMSGGKQISGACSDEELVELALQGEAKALEQLYHRHVDNVYRRLSRLLGPDPEREDLVQHIFTDVVSGLGKFRREARFSTYLYRITTNVAYDHLKRRIKHRNAPLRESTDELTCPALSPEAVTAKREQLALAWHLLDRLKPKKRIAFLLRVSEGLSLEEIAQQVGARPQAVAQRIHHAQRELLAMMKRTTQEAS